jgi:hypothetical protein
MRLDHAIFHAPLQPKLALGEIPAPENYKNWEREIAPKFTTWCVQEGDLGKTVDYGLVSNPYGFEDSPDTEYISSGVNSKGPKSMAIGRHGNWFLWGFAGDPMQMTDGARQVFLNSICWMKQFDGKAPLATHGAAVRQMAPHRDEALVHVQFLRAYGKEKSMQSYVRGQFPPALWEKTKGDADALEAHFRANFEWIVPTKQHVVQENEGPDGKMQKYEYDQDILDVDPVLADAAVSNRKPEFFDFWNELLTERGPDDATVKELADRYLPPEAPRTEEAFGKWLAAVKERLYFSDVYGFRWFVAPEEFAKKGAPGAEAAATKGAGSE